MRKIEASFLHVYECIINLSKRFKKKESPQINPYNENLIKNRIVNMSELI
jgi:hypothetical protein